MNIEFQTPYKKVSEKLIGEIRNEILGLSHINKKISKADVVMREIENIQGAENKICEISLGIMKDNMLVHARKESFEKAAKEAIKELKRLVNQQLKNINEIPEKNLS